MFFNFKFHSLLLLLSKPLFWSAKFDGNVTKVLFVLLLLLLLLLINKELFECIGAEKNKDDETGVNKLLATDEFEIVEGETETFFFSDVVESGSSEDLG